VGERKENGWEGPVGGEGKNRERMMSGSLGWVVGIEERYKG
jgi:hypothetical protein